MNDMFLFFNVLYISKKRRKSCNKIVELKMELVSGANRMYMHDITVDAGI